MGGSLNLAGTLVLDGGIDVEDDTDGSGTLTLSSGDGTFGGDFLFDGMLNSSGMIILDGEGGITLESNTDFGSLDSHRNYSLQVERSLFDQMLLERADQIGAVVRQDHRVLNKATVTATRYTRNVLFYEGPTTRDFTPSVFVGLNDVIDTKVRALEAHASQVKKTNIGDLNIVELVEATSLFRGTQARIKHAEGFTPLRLFINVAAGE